MGKKPQENLPDENVSNEFGITIKTEFPDFGKRGGVSTLAQAMRFNPSAYEHILQLIRDGVWDYVAAESLGTHPVTFYKWMKKGRLEVEAILKEHDEDGDIEKEYSVSVHGKFYLDVRQAHSQARSFRERKVAKDNPLAWLSRGPGHSRQDLPGWTEETQRIITEDQTEDQEDYTRAPTDAATLGAAFDVLEELGYITMTPLGKATFIPKQIVDGTVEPESNGKSNGQ